LAPDSQAVYKDPAHKRRRRGSSQSALSNPTVEQASCCANIWVYMCSLIPSLMYSRGDALKYPLHCCHQVSQFAPVSGLRSTPSIAARHRRAGSARRRRLWHDVGAERRALAGRVQLDAVDCGATSAQSVVRRRASSARRRRWWRDMGAVRQRAISARRSRWRRDIGAERRAPASGTSAGSAQRRR